MTIKFWTFLVLSSLTLDEAQIVYETWKYVVFSPDFSSFAVTCTDLVDNKISYNVCLSHLTSQVATALSEALNYC